MYMCVVNIRHVNYCMHVPAATTTHGYYQTMWVKHLINNF